MYSIGAGGVVGGKWQWGGCWCGVHADLTWSVVSYVDAQLHGAHTTAEPACGGHGGGGGGGGGI